MSKVSASVHRSFWSLISFLVFSTTSGAATVPTVDDLFGQLQACQGQLAPNQSVDDAMALVIARVDANNAEAQLNLGNALLRMKHYSAAVTALKNATRLDERNAAAHGLLGFAAYWQPNCSLALPAYTKALALAPNNPSAFHWNLGVGFCSIEKGNFSLAESSCAAAKALRPTDPKALMCLGTNHFFTGAYAQSLADFQKVPGLTTDSYYVGRAKSGAVASLVKLGRREQAKELYKQQMGPAIEDQTLSAFLASAVREIELQKDWVR